jgi:hypothetical protein
MNKLNLPLLEALINTKQNDYHLISTEHTSVCTEIKIQGLLYPYACGKYLIDLFLATIPGSVTGMTNWISEFFLLSPDSTQYSRQLSLLIQI